MIATNGYAVQSATTPVAPFSYSYREPGENDVLIDVQFCGICHSDIHQARNEWGNSLYPMVPGHEVIGTVARVGSKVTKFKAGDLEVEARARASALYPMRAGRQRRWEPAHR